MKQSEIDYYVYSKKMTSRFYRAQGKRGRCLQDRQLHFFSVRTSKEYLRNKEITEAELEKQCLDSLAKKCGAYLCTG